MKQDKVKISEERLYNVINSCIQKRLNEMAGRTIRRDEAFGDLASMCQNFHMQFIDMKDGETFAVACRLDPDTAEPLGNVEDFERYIGAYIEDGEIEEVKGGILKIGVWYKQYKILADLV